MQLHFPPPPPISQAYHQIQYHQPVQTSVAQPSQTGPPHFVIAGPPPQNHGPPQHIVPPGPPQYDGQPPPPQIHGGPQPPAVSQSYMVPTSQAMVDQHGQLSGGEIHSQDGPVDQGLPPQPVPPPTVNQMQQHSMNLITSVPPPSHPAPWLYQGQPPQVS